MDNYLEYQSYISDIPSFLDKYLELDIMKRLKDISVLCGMDYASPHMYDFKFYLSRYNHSLNVALITWRLTHDKKQTLAALFHDISTPVFSHVIDYMNKDFIKQESTESKTIDILRSSKQLIEYLKQDNIDINEVINFKQYSVVDLPRPALCADRLDNLVGGGMSWAKKVDLDMAKSIIDNIYLYNRSDSKDEIAVRSYGIASYLMSINNEINRLTHTKEDTYMMMLLANIVKLTIDEGLITYNDLYRLTEHQYMDIVEKNLDIYDLNDMWHTWKTVESCDTAYDIQIKDLTLSPIYNGSRVQ